MSWTFKEKILRVKQTTIEKENSWEKNKGKEQDEKTKYDENLTKTNAECVTIRLG